MKGRPVSTRFWRLANGAHGTLIVMIHIIIMPFAANVVAVSLISRTSPIPGYKELWHTWMLVKRLDFTPETRWISCTDESQVSACEMELLLDR